MAATSAVFATLSWKVPISRRVYYIITTLITIISALSYFAEAAGQGKVLHCVTMDHRHSYSTPVPIKCRELYWARYVDWGLTTPLLLLELCLLADIDGGHTLMAISADLIMMLAGMFSAFAQDNTAQKWGWYTIACIAYLIVICQVGVHGFRAAAAKSQNVVKLWRALAVFALILWTAYPV